ncbi:MAG: MMPL family transporter [Acidimicrobiales bacterium]
MAAFNWIFHLPGVDPTVPLLTFVFLVALGVDYNIFLLSRVSEEVGLSGPWRGAQDALVATGGVLTSAGLILAGTFSILSILPALPSEEIGVAAAVGVIIDTFLVRTLIVPALAIDFGHTLWRPTRVAERGTTGHQQFIEDGPR